MRVTVQTYGSKFMYGDWWIIMSELCLGCMREGNGTDICPYCGFNRNTPQDAPFLPLGTILQEHYIVGKKLENNAEGARYIGYDQRTRSTVVIHEFLPAGICGRAKGKTPLVVREGYSNTFQKLGNEFLKYYRTVARLRELNSIAPIFDIFSEFNTAYTVEEFFDFIPFTEYIARSGGSVDWNTARSMFMPLLSSLIEIHNAGILHLGISPDNLVVTSAGKLKLCGFAIREIRSINPEFNAELYDGASAPEQYKIGSVLTKATDVYGFTATLFYALVGKLPETANRRKSDGKLQIPTSVFKKLPPHIVTALADGLQVRSEIRTADFEKLRTQLSAAPTVNAIRAEATRNAAQSAAQQRNDTKKRSSGIPGFAWVLLSCLSALLIITIAGIIYLSSNPFKELTADISAESSSESSVDVSVADNEIIIPNLVGQNYNDIIAKQTGESNYQVLLATESIFSDSYPEGWIISQSPDPNTTAEKGAYIVVTISKGAQNRTLPSVSNKTVEAAVSLLNEEGFIATSSLVYSDTVEAGRVIGYDQYNAGDTAPYGSKITLKVSLGPET